MVEFDPNMNMLQMEYQIRQIESLLSMPVHLQTDISVVSCTAGLTGSSHQTHKFLAGVSPDMIGPYPTRLQG